MESIANQNGKLINWTILKLRIFISYWSQDTITRWGKIVHTNGGHI